MPKQVLYTAFDLVPHPKGASTHITYFVEALTGAGYEVTLMTAGDPSLPTEDRYAGARMIRVPWSGTPHFLRRALDFGEAIKAHVFESEPYDLVHCRSIWGGYPLARLREEGGHQFKLLYEVNGLPSIELKYHYPQLRGTDVLSKCFERELYTLQQADQIISPSQVTRLYLENLRLPTEKIKVIPNGVDTALFNEQIEPF